MIMRFFAQFTDFSRNEKGQKTQYLRAFSVLCADLLIRPGGEGNTCIYKGYASLNQSH
jgi:hypothetical protein